ncbi:uncharacterized protein N7503_003480 [Penicillium pulvis]|uniref:uncharacterized protein n=1 Tax=Penicillium pulvis TaxID=1562058 RepID=UPI002547DAA4|nr:uncharacterized protein N7503_003480 [Penicillium pulvis]KAJ5805878.1 hypothetical protein N7503_003480 [Penicillium pulvis]
METAPLTLAHTHARNAVLETRKSNPVAASEEHDLAAGEFAAAALDNPDQEALRTLQLLENHHKKLAEILRFQHEHPANAEEATATASPSPTTQHSLDTGHTKAGAPISQDAQGQPPRLPGNARIPSRESSSIASNLASARGIPAQPRRGSPVSPTLSAHQAGAKMTDGPSKIKTGESRLREVPNKNRSSRSSAPRQPWSPPHPQPSPTDITSQELVPESAKTGYSNADEPFQRFYSTFEGLISKISAPLAFAGLPLGTEGPTKTNTPTRKSSAETKVDRHHATSDKGSTLAESDVNRLFSQAALRSIRDNPGSSPGNTTESFYVVPTTGGTMSYAGIMTRAEKEARRNSLEDGDEDFVDARETPSSPELRLSTGSSKTRTMRRGAADKLTSLQNPKTLEELQMENQALKHLSDTLSKRLHMWEVNAQSSSMALQQSLRAIHHQSPEAAPHGSSVNTSPVAQMSVANPLSDPDDKVKELEDLVRRGEQELERVGKENDKLKNVLNRYRDRWEKLKEGAKTRRAEVRSNDSNPSTPTGSSRTPEIPASPHPDTASPGKFNTQQSTGREAERKQDSSSI